MSFDPNTASGQAASFRDMVAVSMEAAIRTAPLMAFEQQSFAEFIQEHPRVAAMADTPEDMKEVVDGIVEDMRQAFFASGAPKADPINVEEFGRYVVIENISGLLCWIVQDSETGAVIAICGDEDIARICAHTLSGDLKKLGACIGAYHRALAAAEIEDDRE